MIIYQIKNIKSNKLYVGQTIQHFNRRLRRHINCLKKNNHPNQYLQNSWNKHGKENFKFEILEKCDNIDILNEREEYWINKLKSHHTINGFNLMWGGNNNKHSEESKKKMSDSHIGIFEGEDNPFYNRTHSKETKEKWSKKRKGKQKGKNNPFFGKTHSDEVINKINKTRKERKVNYRSVMQIDMNLNIINKFESIKEAEQITGICRAGISSVCRGIQHTAGNHIWRYC